MPVKNQLNGPLPRKKRVDSKGRHHARMWLKKGKSRMLLAQDVDGKLEAFKISMIENAKKLGINIEGLLVITK
jgi:hypothetical protein